MTSTTTMCHHGLMNVRLSDISLFVTLFALENFACLVPENDYIVSIFKYSDIGVALALLWSIWAFLLSIGHNIGKLHFVAPAVLAVISICCSSVSAYVHLGQPIIQGILPLRRMVVVGLFCFALCRALRLGLISRDRLITMLYIIGVIELILFTAQAILVGHVTFLKLNTDESRFGMTRLRVPYLLTTVLGIFSFRTVLTNSNLSRSRKIFHLIFCIWSILLLGFVVQNRAPTLILIISYILAFLIWHGGMSNKIVGITVLCVLIAIFSSTDLFQSSLQGLMGQDTSAQTATLTIRQSGQMYYIHKLQASPLFGYGVPNENFPPATIAAGENLHYFAADNGIFGFTYELGLFGLFWLVVLYTSAMKRSIGVFRSTGDFSYLQYFLFEIGNLYIGMHWFYYYPLPFMVVLVLLDTERKSNNDGKNLCVDCDV